MSLLRSPLHDRHLARGARMAGFGGWEMPLEYPGGGVLKEHLTVRDSVGVFDVSHLGKLTVRGEGSVAFVNACLSNDLARIGPGRAQYTLCCEEASGGVIDDLIAYQRGDDELLLVPNAANTAEVARRLDEAAPTGVDVVSRHRNFAVLAVQGNRSDEVISAVGLPTGHDYMAFADAEFAGEPVVVCRTGYTGERGYELVVPNGAAVPLWDAVLESGEPYSILPCGLGARDTLRTEMGYPLHGQDISPDVSPVQARLGWAVGWNKDSFWGRKALVAEKAARPTRLLRGLVSSGRGIPRPHMRVLDADGTDLGEVTSGTFSPSRRVGLGLAMLAAHVADGEEVFVDVRGRREGFVITEPPFVTPSVHEP